MEINSVKETVECSSLFGIKVDSIDKMSSPSDLFGKEILSWYIAENEYGVLKFNPIVVPDVSNNKEEFESFKVYFNDIKKFMIEKDLLEKGNLAFFMKKLISFLPIDYGNNKVYVLQEPLIQAFVVGFLRVE